MPNAANQDKVDKVALETKNKIQKQLNKIVHRTWYIFDKTKQKSGSKVGIKVKKNSELMKTIANTLN